MNIQYYFMILEDETALVRAVREDEDGRELSYSDHSSEDESQADGDGSAYAPEWRHGWDKCSKERAESMLQFQFDDEAVANA
jgi:hypothetical protein